MFKIIIFLIIILSLSIIGYVMYTNISLLPPDLLNFFRSIRDTGQEVTKSVERTTGIPLKAKVFDDDFVVEEFVTGLKQPTTMTFVGNDILLLEKNSGHIKLIQDGKISLDPLYDFEVVYTNESGLLGITSNDNDVYIFVTESESDGGKIIGNNIYHFTWDGNNLINKQLLNTLSSESSWHNGGAMTVDLDGNIFAVIGDQMAGYENQKQDFRILQNVKNGELDDSGIIVKVGFEENVIKPRLSEDPLKHYFAIGIRNSFGLAIDPFTGNMWDTEDGPENFDEVNFVSENFNSGWSVVMGPATQEQLSQIPLLSDFKYSDPEFSWEKTVTPTSLEFINSDKFSKYEGELIVSSCNSGQVFKFKLNEQRTGFSFDTPHLQDLVANYGLIDSKNDFESMDEILFGDGFGCITDIEFGPDGYLYIISINENSIFRILPKN